MAKPSLLKNVSLPKFLGITATLCAAAGLFDMPAFGVQSASRPKTTGEDSALEFEVATIKLHNPEARGFGLGTKGRNFFATNASLGDLLAFAFGIHSKQIAHGPTWLTTEKYDVLAEPEAGDKPSLPQLKAMVQKLVIDRFSLVFHFENRQLAIYAIVTTKRGAKFTSDIGDPNGVPSFGFQGLGAMIVKNATVADFANWMQRYVTDRPVVDHTEISGRYNFRLNWTPDESQFGDRAGQLEPSALNAEYPDLFTAIQNQLGLRLESRKGAADILVVDRIERPSEN
jgi:uncharacterized protein (TIGR03435 family)